MPILNRTTLQSFFETGDKPTQAQFAALIDSNLNLSEDLSLLGLREYAVNRSYLLGDSVIYNGAIYVCSANTSGTFNPSNWNKIAGSVPGAVVYKGTWDANSNTPNLQTITPLMGEYYVVSVAGNTNLDGITDWNIGDWAIYNGTVWQKIDNTDMVSDGENVVGTGIGFFKEKTGTLLRFKIVSSSDGSILVTEDETNSFVNLGVNFDDGTVSPSSAWSSQKINLQLSGKIDKLNGVANNFAALDGKGNLFDSRFSPASFLAATTQASGIPIKSFGTITAKEVQSALEQLNTQKEAANPNIQAHIIDFANPHKVTHSQVGLGNVTNDRQLALMAFAEASAEQRTTVATPDYAPALALDFTPPAAGNYFIEWYYEMAKNSAVVTTVAAKVSLNGIALSSLAPRYTTNDNYTGLSGFKMATFAEGVNRITIDFARESGDSGEALIQNISLRVTQF